MTIRFATIEDKTHVLGLIAELMNNAHKLRGEPLISTNDLPQELFEKLLQRDDVKIFLAEEKNKIIGLASLYIIPVMRRTKPRAELEELIVSENERAKGAGTKLLNAAIQYCKDNNVYTLKLSSYLDLTKAHAFYEKQGGKIVEKTFRFNTT